MIENEEAIVEKKDELTINEEKTLISLKDFIKDASNFEEAMDMLNFEGQKHGLRFKKGNRIYNMTKKAMRNSNLFSAIINLEIKLLKRKTKDEQVILRLKIKKIRRKKLRLIMKLVKRKKKNPLLHVPAIIDSHLKMVPSSFAHSMNIIINISL